MESARTVLSEDILHAELDRKAPNENGGSSGRKLAYGAGIWGMLTLPCTSTRPGQKSHTSVPDLIAALGCERPHFGVHWLVPL